MTTDPSPHTTAEHTADSAPQEPQRSTLGLIALITAIVGTVFACIPGALIVGWVLLPVAFILAVASLVQKGKKRGTGITALVLSIVGTIIGVVVFFTVVVGAVDEAFNEGTTGSAPAGEEDGPAAAEETGTDDDGGTEAGGTENDGADNGGADNGGADNSAEQGTRENPYPLGSEITSGDWSVTVNSVDLEATDAVLSENPINEEPASGHTYILVNITAEYTGSDAQGATPWASVAYVSDDGNTFDPLDSVTVAPEAFDRSSALYEGASASGNIALEVPSDAVETGTLRVEPGMLSDAAFVEVS